jgi:hypothetical protein
MSEKQTHRKLSGSVGLGQFSTQTVGKQLRTRNFGHFMGLNGLRGHLVEVVNILRFATLMYFKEPC